MKFKLFFGKGDTVMNQKDTKVKALYKASKFEKSLPLVLTFTQY